MSAENIDQRDGQPPSFTPITDEQDRRIEIWPEFECRACGNDGSLVVWEETSYQDQKQAPGVQYYTGRKPCCPKCGTRVVPDRVDVIQPSEWKQPIYWVISGISGMSYAHPAVENIFGRYEGDPEMFLAAPVSELKTISGVGDSFADQIHTRRATQYPEHTPDVDGFLYEFGGQRLRDMEPSRIARDLTIGFVEADELTPVDDEAARAVLEETADLLRENKDDEFWRANQTSEEIVVIADQLS